jgi:hypothetical protein
MIEKQTLFKGARVDLPVFAQEKVYFRFAVGLAGSV